MDAVHGRHAIVEQLDSGQIHLWLAWLGEITDPRLLNQYQRLLSEEELAKQARLQFERDKHRYLVTRAMVRAVLSKYAEVAPRAWQFTVNDYGKPSIATEYVPALGLQFNASHTGDVVVLGVTRERTIGVDVENVRAREVDIEIADRYFAPEERRALRALPREQQQQRFIEYWTLKESYIKARGMGLSIPLDRFAFAFDDSQHIRLTIEPTLADRPERWAFWQARLGCEHVTAVCVEQSASDQPNVAPVRCWS